MDDVTVRADRLRTCVVEGCGNRFYRPPGEPNQGRITAMFCSNCLAKFGHAEYRERLMDVVIEELQAKR